MCPLDMPSEGTLPPHYIPGSPYIIFSSDTSDVSDLQDGNPFSETVPNKKTEVTVTPFPDDELLTSVVIETNTPYVRVTELKTSEGPVPPNKVCMFAFK